LQVFPLNGTGSATVSYTVFPNFSSTSRTGVLTIGGQTFTLTQNPNLRNQNERIVQLLYYSFFGRLPSQAELTFQVTSGLPLGRGQLALNFANSAEFNNGGRFVAGVYVGLLDRDAEYGGWLFQRNALAQNIITQDTLVQNFITSQEYVLKFGNPDPAAYVRLLYQYILLRPASQAEVDFQVTALAAAGANGRVVLARNFLNSGEFRNGTGPRLTAFLLYATLLLRDGAPGERQTLAAQISAGTPLLNLYNGFVNSGEFNALVN
jgi:hypothetical protein